MSSLPMSQVEILRRLEEELLKPEVRRSPEIAGRFLAEDFVEFGSTGAVYNKAQVLELLQQDVSESRAVISDYEMRRLSANVVLSTYRSHRAGASRLRSSIWKLIEGQWRMVFHQGTPSPSPLED